MQAGSVYRVRTISTVQFLDALAQGEASTAVINPAELANGKVGGAGAGLSAGEIMRNRLHEIRIVSVEPLDWALEFYGTDAFPETTPAIDDLIFLGRFAFSAASAAHDTEDEFYKYWVPGLDMSLQDVLSQGNLYLRLVNLSAAAKSANAAGAVVVELTLEPTFGGVI